MVERAREIEADEYPAMLDWLEKALVGVAIEPVIDGDDLLPVWEVIVHNGLSEDSREEAVMATCENEREAELIASALWALLRIRQALASGIAGPDSE